MYSNVKRKSEFIAQITTSSASSPQITTDNIIQSHKKPRQDKTVNSPPISESFSQLERQICNYNASAQPDSSTITNNNLLILHHKYLQHNLQKQREQAQQNTFSNVTIGAGCIVNFGSGTITTPTPQQKSLQNDTSTESLSGPNARIMKC